MNLEEIPGSVIENGESIHFEDVATTKLATASWPSLRVVASL